jgi:hypothetical protein
VSDAWRRTGIVVIVMVSRDAMMPWRCGLPSADLPRAID